MNIMTKRGSEDNIVTYEHYCDTKADLANIPQDQISLGSVAIVLKDEDDSMGIYLANSNKEWISFSTGGGGNGGESSTDEGNPGGGDFVKLVDGTITEAIDSTVTVVRSSAFAYLNDLTKVSFPACTEIRERAFQWCSELNNVSFPMCSRIGWDAFLMCESLATVSFPACTQIDGEAFMDCGNLMSAYFLGPTVPTLGVSAFYGTPITRTSDIHGSIFIRASMFSAFLRGGWYTLSSRIVGLTDEEIAELDANN